jgi:hypothetical protein
MAYQTVTVHHKKYPWTSVMASPYNCDNTGILNCAAKLEDLKAYLLNAGEIFFPEGTYLISDDLTIPAGMIIRGPKAVINIAAGKTLTLNGPTFDDVPSFIIANTASLVINGAFNAGLRKVFTDSNAGYDGVVFGAGTVKGVCPEWWTVNTTPGTTDMAAAFQSAINSITSTGGIVSLSSTHYAIDTKITIITSAITIKGAGSGSWQTSDIASDKSQTTITYTGTDACFECGDTLSAYSGIQFEGFRLILANGTDDTIGINYKGLCHTNCNAEDLFIVGPVRTNGTTWANYKSTGIRYGERCESNRINNCGFFYLNIGLHAYGYDDNLIVSQCKFIRTKTAGIKAGDAASIYLAGWGLIIRDNHFGLNGKSIWLYRTPRNSRIEGNYFENSQGANDLAVVLGDASYPVYSVVIESNLFSTSNALAGVCADYGIDIINADGVSIKDNIYNLYATKFIHNSGTVNNDHIEIGNNQRYAGTICAEIDDLTGVVYHSIGYDYGPRYVRNSAGQVATRWRLAADTYDRVYMTGDGKLYFGSGAAAQDAGIERKAADIIGAMAGDKWWAAAGICLNYVAGDVTGTAKPYKIQVYDTNGTSIGYLQVYAGP